MNKIEKEKWELERKRLVAKDLLDRHNTAIEIHHKSIEGNQDFASYKQKYKELESQKIEADK